MLQAGGNDRVFLFLQGPHGPFFKGLANMLRRSGATCYRVGFNAGDAFFWKNKETFIPFKENQKAWSDFFETLIAEKSVTDLVLYGDVREIHAQAIKIAKANGIQVHIFEEGYLRPFWITYERDGSNGNSRLMNMTIPQMQKALEGSDLDPPMPPSHWGDMRQHVFYGALYHWFVMFRNHGFKNFKPHRALNVRQEFRLYLRRLLRMPMHALERRIATYRVRYGGFPYHLALLQLEHDSSFQEHSPFNTMAEFLELVMENFAQGAPQHHHLVIKAHPLEDGRIPVRRTIKKLAKTYGVEDRVHFVRGGKLAQLLNDARSAVTVNSTAGQQVLWRGIPLKIFGKAVYDQPEFIANQSLSRFFAGAIRPDMMAYREYRRFLLETSQVSGGFYSRAGRRQLMRQVVDMMLSPEDPYEALASGTAAPRQQLRAVT
ncbi:Capsule polysaccharide biosynthesis protein [Cognatishimia activa]|uniref:Capsule polysaccharide biosynthesis protein n=1 Tax=Cognatishimia activa TaxID=1715691 RepID=A0A0P1IN39_9RHOB|nr:capsular biosynthesis protein [Cognatishimia activa]CUK25012.1 Capsule polysaccharide biosynthesis protein [Cognatishimia activa]